MLARCKHLDDNQMYRKGQPKVPTLYVRDVPDQLYDALKERATREGRSVSAETIVLLRHALGGAALTQDEILKRIAARPRFSSSAAGAPSSVDLIREDRAR